MSSTPLVCNVAGPVVFPGQKMNLFQPIPKATDLKSALAAIQAITNNFYTLAKSGNFVEQRELRTYNIVRVFNPEDTEQWVDVQQITGLVFIDKVTGRTITWKQ